jgi:hypothetical protein
MAVIVRADVPEETTFLGDGQRTPDFSRGVTNRVDGLVPGLPLRG